MMRSHFSAWTSVTGRLASASSSTMRCQSSAPAMQRAGAITGKNNLMGQQYDPKGLDVTKTKQFEGIHGPVLSMSERNARIDNIFESLVRHTNIVTKDERSFEDAFDDDDAADKEQARVDFDLESMMM
ncbi:hypothetical protein HAX54_011217 [Datura stramonium]|uniref:Uncharacterized protein n=1 Tax=Datura stramonium TaxID=4076 RepID=A0ABS8TK90_DATST|nr:hypothetical protein [Datura stramonium]